MFQKHLSFNLILNFKYPIEKRLELIIFWFLKHVQEIRHLEIFEVTSTRRHDERYKDEGKKIF